MIGSCIGELLNVHEIQLIITKVIKVIKDIMPTCEP